MRLPLFLCVALASALAGCNGGGCTVDHCTITSMMGETQSAPTSQASTTQSAAPTYQAPSNQASSKVDLSGYGGMYAGVKIPDDSQSSRSTYQAPSRQTSTYQATRSATTTHPPGYVAPSIVRGGCNNSEAAGQYFPDTNTVHMCEGDEKLSPAFRRFTVLHEEGHAVDFQKNASRFSPDLEYQADKYAIDRLLKAGDYEAIEAKSKLPQGGIYRDYAPGTQNVLNQCQ